MKAISNTFGTSFTTYKGIALLGASLFLAACQPIQPPAAPTVVAAEEATVAPAEETNTEINQVTITAQDFAFEMPDEIPAGLTSFTLTNEGQVNHHAYVARLLEGVTMEQVTAAMATEGEEAEGTEPPAITDLAFFLPDTDPGKSNQATVELAPGSWFIASFSVDASTGDPAPDWTKGSLKEFTVTESDGTMAVAPEADVVVTIHADDFDMPTEIAAGEQTIQVVNASDVEDGYVFFIKLGGDTTVESILTAFEAMFAGQEPEAFPEFSAVGGLMGYSASDNYYTTITFEPGNYAAISNINGDDFPYAGLSKSFTVK